jgi:hypothetical protein
MRERKRVAYIFKMPPLLSSTDFPAIRAAIDLSLDEATLPDDVIWLDIYVGEAERYVASQTADTGQNAKNAVVYWAASLIAPSVPQLTGERDTLGESYQRKVEDVAELVARLRAKAAEQIDIANEVDPELLTTANRPTFFALASGTRGL